MDIFLGMGDCSTSCSIPGASPRSAIILSVSWSSSPRDGGRPGLSAAILSSSGRPGLSAAILSSSGRPGLSAAILSSSGRPLAAASRPTPIFGPGTPAIQPGCTEPLPGSLVGDLDDRLPPSMCSSSDEEISFNLT